MRPFITTLYLILPAFAGAEPAFHFDTGEDWRGERIELPPGFAPSMKWSGVEQIRFAPGMFDPAAEFFFSYALVFLLEEGSDVSREAIHEQVLTYYKGLAEAVMKGPVDTDKFTLELGAAESSEQITSLTAELDWVEPFATRKPQTLNLEIKVWKHGNQPALFFAVSPRPKDHEIWKKLRRIRDNFRFED